MSSIPTSQNGWPRIASSTDPRLVDFPEISGKVRAGDVATLFSWLCMEFDGKVEPIDRAQSWGWSYRRIRGSLKWSNHSSGTAIDLNSARHPLGMVSSFTTAQVRTIHAILARTVVGGVQVIRWGGDYAGRTDEMHFEVNRGVSPAQVAAAVAQVLGQAVTPPPLPVLRLGSRGELVKTLQRKLGVRPTGYYWLVTYARVRAWQKAHHLTVDGVAGPQTLGSLGITASR